MMSQTPSPWQVSVTTRSATEHQAGASLNHHAECIMSNDDSEKWIQFTIPSDPYDGTGCGNERSLQIVHTGTYISIRYIIIRLQTPRSNQAAQLTHTFRLELTPHCSNQHKQSPLLISAGLHCNSFMCFLSFLLSFLPSFLPTFQPTFYLASRSTGFSFPEGVFVISYWKTSTIGWEGIKLA